MCAASFATATLSQAEITSLLIGDDGQCLARDFRQIALVEGEQDVVFEHLPREADPATLQIWAPRAGVQLLSWSLTAGDENAALRCRIRSSLRASRAGVDLIYAFTGLTWTAHYEAWIRAEMGDRNQPVSADLRGTIEIQNRTQTEFSNVWVRLVGREHGTAPAKQPGFVWMDRRTPLSDIFFAEDGDSEPPYAYPLASRIAIPTRTDVAVFLVHQDRAAAFRQYVCSSKEIPLEAKDFLPLRQEICFPYITARSQAMALPPGTVRVSVGPRRERVFDAEFKRAAPGSDIRMDLGASDDVVGRRTLVERSPPVAGYRTETFEWRIQNRSDSAADVRIEEQLATASPYAVVKASAPYEARMNRLYFQCTVPPRSEERLVYTLKLQQPRL
jgi:hypothetical protein